jgi:hypothetical protein
MEKISRRIWPSATAPGPLAASGSFRFVFLLFHSFHLISFNPASYGRPPHPSTYVPLLFSELRHFFETRGKWGLAGLFTLNLPC